MATYIKTLKEDNGDITYPQTKAGAVLLNNGSDLETELSQYVTAEDIASTSAVTPTITTAMIADGAVTSDKIAAGAVTSDKLAWSTLTDYHSLRYTSTFNVTGSSITNIPSLSFTCDKAGTYFLAANGNFQVYSSSTGTYPRIGIYKGNERLTYAAISINGYTGQQTWSTFTTAQLAVGDVIKVAVVSGPVQLFEGQNLFAIRIG